MSGHKAEQVQEPRLLPVAKLNGQEFLVDVENRQFKNINEPGEVIGMHSQQGRKMLKDMHGSTWHCHGLFTETSDEAEV